MKRATVGTKSSEKHAKINRNIPNVVLHPFCTEYGFWAHGCGQKRRLSLGFKVSPVPPKLPTPGTEHLSPVPSSSLWLHPQHNTSSSIGAALRRCVQ